jgi:hypothetical protein
MRPWGQLIDDDIPRYGVATFRTLGTAATPQNIATLENPTASGHLIVVWHCSVTMDSTAVLATVAPSLNLTRLSVGSIAGGTILTNVNHDSTLAPNSVAVARGGTASDGGGATAITATAGSRWRTTLSMRLHTAVGMVLSDKIQLLGPLIATRDYALLVATDALLVQGVVASAATTHFVVNWTWSDLLL